MLPVYEIGLGILGVSSIVFIMGLFFYMLELCTSDILGSEDDKNSTKETYEHPISNSVWWLVSTLFGASTVFQLAMFLNVNGVPGGLVEAVAVVGSICMPIVIFFLIRGVKNKIGGFKRDGGIKHV